jgi:hypothetical protein
LVKGKTVGIDAIVQEANAALRGIVRRDTGESFLTRLAQASAQTGRGGAPGRRHAADGYDCTEAAASYSA